MFLGTWRMMKVPDRMHGEQGHLDIMDDLGRPLGRYLESFVSISFFFWLSNGWSKKISLLCDRRLRPPLGTL